MLVASLQAGLKANALANLPQIVEIYELCWHENWFSWSLIECNKEEIQTLWCLVWQCTIMWQWCISSITIDWQFSIAFFNQSCHHHSAWTTKLFFLQSWLTLFEAVGGCGTQLCWHTIDLCGLSTLGFAETSMFAFLAKKWGLVMTLRSTRLEIYS